MSFHIRRIAVLLNHFSLVADAASWWINLLEPVRRAIPTVKVIALIRDTEDCVRSFDRAVEQNPWAGPWKRAWENRRWDLIMPHYPVPADVAGDPRAAKQAMIRQYVRDYNALISDLAARRECELMMRGPRSSARHRRSSGSPASSASSSQGRRRISIPEERMTERPCPIAFEPRG